MPNHVENDLVITGPNEDLLAFKEFARGPAGSNSTSREAILSAHKFIPMPDDFWLNDFVCPECAYREAKKDDDDWGRRCPACDKSFLKDGFNRGGYQWCVAHWGTKWGLYSVEVKTEESERISYSFDTAWSPPEPVVKAMVQRFPSLTFDLSYFEGLMEYQGHLQVRGEEVLTDWSGDYDGDRGG